MKKLIKKLKAPVVTLMCLLMLAIQPGFAASVTYVASAASTNNILASAGAITSVVLNGAGATSVKVSLFDAPTNTLTYVIGAYTNYTPTIYNVTNVYSAPFDTTVTNIATVLSNVPSSVAQATNTYRTVASYSVPTNDTVTITYDTIVPFNRGLLVTNSQAVTITVNYLPYR